VDATAMSHAVRCPLGTGREGSRRQRGAPGHRPLGRRGPPRSFRAADLGAPHRASG